MSGKKEKVIFGVRKSIKAAFNRAAILYRELKQWDWKAISLCLAAAFTFWVFNSLNKNHKGNINIPVNFTIPEGDYFTIRQPTDRVKVNVSANGWNLFRKTIGLDIESIDINIDNPLKTKFVTYASLEPLIVNELKQMQVNFIPEDTIFFEFDTLAYKVSKVEVLAEDIMLEQGCRLTSGISVSPDTVAFEGPQRFIESLPDTLRLIVDEEGIGENFDEFIEIDDLDDQQIEADHYNFRVKFDVAHFAELIAPVKLVRKDFPADSTFSILPAGASILFTVNTKEYGIPDVDTVNFILDYHRINPNDSTLFPDYELPEYSIEPIPFPPQFKVIYIPKELL